jgi:hypothetical protein
VDPAGQADPAAQASRAPAAEQTQAVTAGGVRVTRTAEPFSAPDINHICAQVDHRRGRSRRNVTGSNWNARS